MEVRRKILLVDDAPMFLELESVFLARSGQVVTARSGSEALEIARAERPDVIVTDLSMPGMRGDELCQRIKADPDLGRTPVIIVTGSYQGDERELAVRSGASDVLGKPVNRVSLIQAVNHFLRLAERGLLRVPLETDVHLDLTPEETWGRSRNVSRGGMYVEVDGAGADPESELRLEFKLPETPTALAPTAKVVWRRVAVDGSRSGMGLQFLRLDRDAARHIEDFVYEHAGLETDARARSLADLGEQGRG